MSLQGEINSILPLLVSRVNSSVHPGSQFSLLNCGVVPFSSTVSSARPTTANDVVVSLTVPQAEMLLIKLLVTMVAVLCGDYIMKELKIRELRELAAETRVLQERAASLAAEQRRVQLQLSQLQQQTLQDERDRATLARSVAQFKRNMMVANVTDVTRHLVRFRSGETSKWP